MKISDRGQKPYFKDIIEKKIPVNIFLMNGVKMKGSIAYNDKFCILFKNEGKVKLIYKHAISTITPLK